MLQRRQPSTKEKLKGSVGNKTDSEVRLFMLKTLRPDRG